MSGVDQRIVEMTFKGDTLISGIKNAVSALTSLKTGLNSLKGSESDINNLDAAGKKFSLSGIADGVEGIKSKFSSMSVVGIAALASVTTRAVDAGISLVKAFTVDPIREGLASYETKINAIQTILANTASEGTNLQQVTNALQQLNEYSNLTVFNFADMAKNIGTFTAAGVGLSTSVASIKGIANLAALSGSSAEQASTGMYQLSQAIAAGVVKLQDWNSVVNAGFGGKVFQNALIETARVNGVAVDAMIAKYGSFRQSLQGGWLSAKILTETLSEFTGDLSKSQLEAMGFTAQESTAIMKQAAIAVQSATQIRTITQLTAALKDDVSTAWAGVWEAIIGNSQQAPKVLTAVFNGLSGAILSPIHDLTNLIFEFDNLGGRTAVIQLITNAVKALGVIFHSISGAWATVFPPSGTSSVNAVVSAIQNLANHLKISSAAASEIKTIFEGVFSVFKIVEDLVGAVAAGFGKMSSSAQSSSGGVLALLASIASFIIKVKDSIEQGDALTKIFQGLGTVLSLPIKAIGLISSALGGVTGAATGAVSGVSSFIAKVGDEFSKLASAVINGIKSGNLASIGTLLNQLLLGGVLVSIKKFITGLGASSSGGGLFDSIKESFEGLTNTLKTMQQTLKSETLEKIAIAVALLTASMIGLSFVNIGNLTKALTAITVLFTELLTALDVVSKIAGSSGIVKMTAISLALNLLATAILVLTGAVAILAQFSWDQLAKGLSAIAVLLAELVVATNAMSANSKGLIASAVAMNVMASALNVMALAVALLGKLDLSTLAKGIGTITALLAVILAFQTLSGSGEKLISSAAGMVLIGAALVIMSSAVAKLGALSLPTLAKGIGAIAATLAILVVAMNAMSGGIVGAAAMIVAAAALLILSKAINSLGAESWGEIGKALVTLAAALDIMAAGMAVMVGALPGAAALLVVAAALAILTPVLVVLGGLSWDTIIKGLVALAGIFAVVGVAGLLLAPVVPVLLGLGAAVALFGVGILAVGAGVLVFAIGLGVLSVSIVAAAAAFLAFVKVIAQLGPEAIASFAKGIADMAKAIGAAGTAIVNAFTAIFTAVLSGITKLAPKFAAAVTAIVTAMVQIITTDVPKMVNAFLAMLQKILTSIATYFPKFAATAIQIVTNMLNAIAGKIPAMAQAAVNLCVAFINAIGKSTVQVVAAAVKMVIGVINGIANTIRAQTPALQAAMRNLGTAMVQGIIAGLESLAGALISALGSIVSNAVNAAKNLIKSASPSKLTRDEIGVPIIEGIVVGVLATGDKLNGSMVTVAQNAITSFKDALGNASDLLGGGLNLNPVITPVIDLTQARQGLTTLNGLTKSQLIDVGTSSSTAASISAANAAAASQAGLITPGGTSLVFNQTNNSPVALSAIDIYRRTKNQISIAKGVLSGNANPS